MKRIGAIIVSAGALALVSCGHKTETTENRTTKIVNETAAAPVLPIVSPGQTFANAAAASDAFEIATSNLALTKAHAPSVKAFARQMVKAHTDSTAKLKAAAAPAIMPDATLTADQQRLIDSMNTLEGADFDKAYVAAQTDAHTKTLAALKDYSATGDVPSLRAFAIGLVPTVTAHLNMAKGLKP
jgi:putative membrane protein